MKQLIITFTFIAVSTALGFFGEYGSVGRYILVMVAIIMWQNASYKNECN